MSTLNELVRDQILAEGPQIENKAQRDHYIDRELNAMSNVELLERISDAMRELQRAVKPKTGELK